MFCAVKGPREVFQAPSGAGTPCSAQDERWRTLHNVQDGASQGHSESRGYEVSGLAQLGIF